MVREICWNEEGRFQECDGIGCVAIEGQMEYQREREEAKEGTTSLLHSWLEGFILRGEQKVVEHCEEVMGQLIVPTLVTARLHNQTQEEVMVGILAINLGTTAPLRVILL